MDGGKDSKKPKEGAIGIAAAELGAFKAEILMGHGLDAPFQVSISGFGLAPSPPPSAPAPASAESAVDIEAGGFVDLPEFHSIQSSSQVELHWAQGPPGARFGHGGSVKFAGSMEVVDGVLRISGHDGSTLAIELASERLDRAQLGGKAKLEASLDSPPKFEAKLAGASKLDFKGSASKLIVDASDASWIDAKDLACESVFMNLSGSVVAIASFSKVGGFNLSSSSQCLAHGDGELSVGVLDDAQFEHVEGLATQVHVVAAGRSRAKVAFEGVGDFLSAGRAKVLYIGAPGATLASGTRTGQGTLHRVDEARSRLGRTAAELQAEALPGMSGKIEARRAALLSMASDASEPIKPPTTARG